jgi:hypothetical protein
VAEYLRVFSHAGIFLLFNEERGAAMRGRNAAGDAKPATFLNVRIALRDGYHLPGRRCDHAEEFFPW